MVHRGRSLKHKLRGVLMMTCGLALALAGIAFAVNDWLSGKRSTLHDLTILADVIGTTSKDALLFRERHTAQQTLAALRAEPSIVAAAIYAADKTLLATYPRGVENVDFYPFPTPPHDHRFQDGQLHVYRPILTEGQRIGTVYLKSDLQGLYAQLRHQLTVITLVLIGSYLVALLLSSKLQQKVSGPILQLAGTARAISRDKNYTLRATSQGLEEVGVLVDAFNDMLTQIQARDDKLERYTAHLEELVARRTEQLQKANQRLQDQARDLEQLVAKRTAELRSANQQLQHQAYHDNLTSLPNRSLFFDRLTQAIYQAQRRHQILGVLFLDLDRFKFINDTLGHAVGDQLLRMVATRVRACVRKDDTIARLGGDEFTILLNAIRWPEDAEKVAGKILATLLQPFQCDGNEVHVSASIGVAIYPKDGDVAETLMRNADTAMYNAKQQGRNQFRFYAEEMNAASIERLRMENGLRRALTREEFVLHYQPQVAPSSGRVIGVEALLRWADPSRGLQPPARFLPLLEETGLIAPVGDWILRRACRQAKDWRDAGIPAIQISVNCSSRQFIHGGLSDTVEKILLEHGVPPNLLSLEMREDVLLESADETIAALSQIAALGVQLVVDDFGTGYSSLGYLRRFPISAVKIDRSLANDVARDPDTSAIVRAIIAVANNLDIKVIAGGVESEETLQFLKDHGCDAVQGFLLGPPTTAEAITQLLLQGSSLTQ